MMALKSTLGASPLTVSIGVCLLLSACAGDTDSAGAGGDDTSIADIAVADIGAIGDVATSDANTSDASSADTSPADTSPADTSPADTGANAAITPLKQCVEDADCTQANLCLGVGVCKKTATLWSRTLAPGSAVKCDTSGDNQCNANTCEPSTGKCTAVAKPDGTICSVDDPCVVQATCKAGACKPGDASWCGCAATADCDALTKKNPCLGSWFCELSVFPYVCKRNEATAVQCDASQSTACATNACSPDTGKCGLLPVKDGTPCDDGNPVTLGDACEAGACKTGAKIFTCAQDSDCNGLEDGDLCNGVLFCDKSDKACKINKSTLISCPSAGDTDCNLNTCDKQTGACNMVAAKNGTACDDGDPCTVGDICLTGQCAAGAVRVPVQDALRLCRTRRRRPVQRHVLLPRHQQELRFRPEFSGCLQKRRRHAVRQERVRSQDRRLRDHRDRRHG